VCDRHRAEAEPRGLISLTVDKQITNARYAVRRAIPADAQAISELYVRVYTPAKGGDARDCYPFPQIMTRDGVAALVAGEKAVWLVGEAPAGTLVGSAAAMRNIGDAPDQIAEVFGVAVDPAHRHGGLGSALVGGLVDQLAGSSKFILCEARTDNAGGWKVARNAGFVPVGYEPYAHSMPVGFESMVLTGHWPRSPHSYGPNGKAPYTGQVDLLRKAVMGLPSAADTRLGSRALAQEREALPSKADVKVRRDDVAGQRWFNNPADIFDRSAGIIGLSPLQGEDHRSDRFTQAYYLALSASSEVGVARVVYDRVDARARVLGLRTVAPDVCAVLLRHLVDDLLRWASEGRLVIIVLVDSNCSQAQADLTNLGFFPTVYLPAFIAAPLGRSDVVQYTRLSRCCLGESTNGVTAKHWPEAERVIAQVLRFAP
jgi:ribosomal protein S18 acetylase RimI-like enzyme